MGFLLKAFREFAYALGVLIVAIVIGQILFMIFRDFAGPPPSFDTSDDAKTGFGVLFGLVVMMVHIIRRILAAKRKKAATGG